MNLATSSGKILAVEDEPEVREYLRIALQSEGYPADVVADGEEAVACLKNNGADYSLVLLDLMMPRKDGIETIREVRQFDTGIPIIMLSGASSPLNIVNAIKCGANDFLSKPVSPEELSRAIEKALRIHPSVRTAPAPDVSPLGEAGGCFAAGPWTKKLDMFLKQVGSAEVPVLLQGETGSGKEVLARKIHACSSRAKKPFLKLNCAALPSELVESELFGYERGAFTGAFRNSPGKFEMAHGGTLLLDEIGDMDFKLQAKLLQVLQDGEFLRLGAKEICRVDVRVIAATHCDLEEAMAEGRFRPDLYYRLNVIRIEVPPLRDRREEILPLAQYFVNKHSERSKTPVEINPRLRQALMAHAWPGNIRELENLMRKLIVFNNSDIVADQLHEEAARRRFAPSREARPQPATSYSRDSRQPVFSSPEPETHDFGIDGGRLADGGDTASKRPSSDYFANVEGIDKTFMLQKVDAARKQAEIETITQALNSTLWNRKEAAARLGIEYKALLYKMKKLNIGEKAFRAAHS